jgi:uncharacterized protein YbjQ (UPF0145 family)
MFTSGILPKEAAMAQAAGLRPLGQVAGTCVYHSNHIHGFGQIAGHPGEIYRFHAPIEAVLLSRRKALRRLVNAAGALGGELVTGIRVTHEERESGDEHDKNGGIVEATATGYAVAREQKPRVKRKPLPVTISADEYWKLLQGGYAPAGMVMTTVMTGSVAARDAGWDRIGAGGRANRELSDVSGMVRAAWQFAEKDIRRQVHAAGGEGVVDVSFTSREWLADPARLTFKMILTVTGTSIAPLARVDDRAGATGERGGLVITPVRHLA